MIDNLVQIYLWVAIAVSALGLLFSPTRKYPALYFVANLIDLFFLITILRTL